MPDEQPIPHPARDTARSNLKFSISLPISMTTSRSGRSRILPARWTCRTSSTTSHRCNAPGSSTAPQMVTSLVAVQRCATSSSTCAPADSVPLCTSPSLASARPLSPKAPELYEIVCQLSQHGLSLPPIWGGRIRAPGARELEMFRLRLVERLTLAEVGERTGVSQERVRQILRLHFGLTDKPPRPRGRPRKRR